MSDLDGSVGVSESENVWREIWGERESKGREKGVKRERESTFSQHVVCVRHQDKHQRIFDAINCHLQ